MNGTKMIWLIGESNPYSAEPRFALYPKPTNATGARLCAALGLTDREYIAAFERRDLLTLGRTGKWSVPAAREAASKVTWDAPEGTSLVLLGGKVAAAFGLKLEPFTVREVGVTCRHRALVLPHPSGLSRVWNTPGTPERVREAVIALGAHPCKQCSSQYTPPLASTDDGYCTNDCMYQAGSALLREVADALAEHFPGAVSALRRQADTGCSPGAALNLINAHLGPPDLAHLSDALRARLAPEVP